MTKGNVLELHCGPSKVAYRYNQGGEEEERPKWVLKKKLLLARSPATVTVREKTCIVNVQPPTRMDGNNGFCSVPSIRMTKAHLWLRSKGALIMYP